MANEVEERANWIKDQAIRQDIGILDFVTDEEFRRIAQADIDWFEAHGYRKVKPAIVPENKIDIHIWREYSPDLAYETAISDYQSLNPEGLWTEVK